MAGPLGCKPSHACEHQVVDPAPPQMPDDDGSLKVFIKEKKSTTDGKWHAPGIDELKINLDGAFTPGSSFASWGVVVRDAHGQLITAHAGRQEHIHDAFGAEVCALTAAVAIAADLGAIRVVFETDSELLAQAMDMTKADSSPYAAAIEDTNFS